MGGRPFRTNKRLLAMSALMSASAYFRLLPPRPATSSSMPLLPMLCAALVFEDIPAQLGVFFLRFFFGPGLRTKCGAIFFLAP